MPANPQHPNTQTCAIVHAQFRPGTPWPKIQTFHPWTPSISANSNTQKNRRIKKKIPPALGHRRNSASNRQIYPGNRNAARNPPPEPPPAHALETRSRQIAGDSPCAPARNEPGSSPPRRCLPSSSRRSSGLDTGGLDLWPPLLGLATSHTREGGRERERWVFPFFLSSSLCFLWKAATEQSR